MRSKRYRSYKTYKMPARHSKMTPRKVQKILHISLLIIVFLFVCFQFATCIHNQTTAPTVPETSEKSMPDNSESSVSESSVPENSVEESVLSESSVSESSVEESSSGSSVPESSVEESSSESSVSESSVEESSSENSSDNLIYAPTYFKETAFMGNSLIAGFDVYNIEPNATYYWSIGMSAYGALHSPMTGSENTPVEEICTHEYQKVFLMFGTNELGWSSSDSFIENYGEVIDEIHTAMPNAQIYIQSITPVSASVDKKNQNGINNARIEEYNLLLQNLAVEQDVGYLDIASIYKDDNGNMADKYSGGDGIHLSPDAYYLWLDYIMEYA